MYQEGVSVMYVRANIDPGRSAILSTPSGNNLTAEA
jgi:hypothetical protein